MSITTYTYQDKKYFKILIRRRDSQGKRIRTPAEVDQNGNRIDSQQLAEKTEKELKIDAQSKFDMSHSLTWERWHKIYLNRIKKGTHSFLDDALKKWLSPEWKQTLLLEISQKDISKLISYMEVQEGYTQKIKHRVLKKIRTIFSLAVRDKVIPRNPIKTEDLPPSKIKALNNNQAHILLEAARLYSHPFYYHWVVSLQSGIKSSELYSLRWKNIDLSENKIIISHQWTSKYGIHSVKNNRTVPISRILKKLLLELKIMGPFHESLGAGINNIGANSTCLYDLVLPRNKKWRQGTQSKELEIFCKKIEIEAIKFNDLKNTYTVNLLNQGHSLAKALAISGMTESKHANEYIRLSQELPP